MYRLVNSAPAQIMLHRHDTLTASLIDSRRVVAWNGTAAPHTLQIVRLDIPYEHATRAGCKRSHTELLRCVPGNSPTGNRITGMHAAGQVAGCGAQLRSTALLPSQFRQSLPAARVVTYKTEASESCFAAILSVNWNGASGRGCLTISPQPAQEHPHSHETISRRVLHSGHTP